MTGRSSAVRLVQRLAVGADGRPNVLGKCIVLAIRVVWHATEGLASAVARRWGRGVVWRSLDVTVECDAHGTTVLLRYGFAADKRSRSGPLLFDARGGPLVLAPPGLVPERLQALVVRGSPVALAVSPPESGWDGLTVDIEAKWPDDSDSPCLALPGSVPIPILDHVSDRPEIRLDMSAAGDLEVLGVEWGGGPETSIRGALLEAGLFRGDTSSDDRILLSGRLAAGLADDGAALRRRIASSLRVLGAELGRDVPARVLWGELGEPWLRPGRSSCFPLTNPDRVGRILFGYSVSGLWWGAGVRLVGDQWLLIEWALRVFSALLLVQRTAANELEGVRAGVQAIADRGSTESISSTIIEGVDIARVCRLGLLLFAAHLDGDEILQVLRRVVRDRWGQNMQVSELQSGLSACGVDLLFA